ncbi:uncharacterized protein LOC120326012 [Styela clava]|uniref:ephrin-B2a-like n=1 Tax=Styela clava TaxID=7725 RepID=UPI00193A1F23|nr:ephrin-B2a-like [Styela clava]
MQGNRNIMHILIMRPTRSKMLEVLVVATSFVLLACGVEFATVDAASDVKSIPAIYWNISDPIFKAGSNYVQYVELEQKMDIICPLRQPKQPNGLYYFILYQVTRENYLSCNTKGQKKLLTCDDPDEEKKYTFLFNDISPSPWGLTFHADETYYFISTSDGTVSGIKNEKGGACTEKNMRLMITVKENGKRNKDVPKTIVPDVHKPPSPTVLPRPINTIRHTYKENINENTDTEEGGGGGKRESNNTELVNSNGLVIGVVLGACAVLFIVLLGFLGYKVYRKRRHVKKYQHHPGIVASRSPTPQTQVTLMRIPSHQAAQLRVHSTGRPNSHHHHLEIQDLPAPPPYNETMMDHAGSTMEV